MTHQLMTHQLMTLGLMTLGLMTGGSPRFSPSTSIQALPTR